MTENKQKRSIFEWETSLYTEHQRGTKWYIVSVLVTVLTFLFSIIFGSKMFALVVIILSLAYFPLTFKKVPHVKVVITSEGIYFGQHFYAFQEIEYFWIEEYLPSFQSIHLQLKKSRINDVEIQFYDHKKEDLIIVLQQFSPFNPEKQPSFFSHLAHIFKL